MLPYHDLRSSQIMEMDHGSGSGVAGSGFPFREEASTNLPQVYSGNMLTSNVFTTRIVWLLSEGPIYSAEAAVFEELGAAVLVD
ncbi:hypothetical protein Tco_1182870 [Tanacetum coccineum]